MRSKACSRCQHRKKKCDRKRPFCTACANALVQNECVYTTQLPLRFIAVTPQPSRLQGDTATGERLGADSACNQGDRASANTTSLLVARRKLNAASNNPNWCSPPSVLAPGSAIYGETQRHLTTTGARVAMLDRWFGIYFPSSGAIPLGIYYMADRLMNTEAGTIASDLGCLLQLGTLNTDPRLMRAAVTLYPNVLQTLRNTLRQLDPGTLLAVVHCIQINEQFSILSGGQSSSWTRHTAGIKAALKVYIEKNGENSTLAPGAQHAFVRNFRDFGLWHGLRGGGSAADYARIWDADILAIEARACSAAASFDNLAVEVTTMVEICQRLCIHQNVTTASVLTLFGSRLAGLEQLLHQWKASELETTCKKDFPRIAEPGAAAREVYTTTDAASLDMCYWGCLVAIQRCRLDLHKTVGGSVESLQRLSFDAQSLKVTGSNAAWNLLQGIQYMMQEDNGFMGVMSSMAPLRYTLDWYEKMGDDQGIAACSLLQKSAERRGICFDF